MRKTIKNRQKSLTILSFYVIIILTLFLFVKLCKYAHLHFKMLLSLRILL